MVSTNNEKQFYSTFPLKETLSFGLDILSSNDPLRPYLADSETLLWGVIKQLEIQLGWLPTVECRVIQSIDPVTEQANQHMLLIVEHNEKWWSIVNREIIEMTDLAWDQLKYWFVEHWYPGEHHLWNYASLAIKEDQVPYFLQHLSIEQFKKELAVIIAYGNTLWIEQNTDSSKGNRRNTRL